MYVVEQCCRMICSLKPHLDKHTCMVFVNDINNMYINFHKQL